MDDMKTEIWLNILSDIPFEQASRNLKEHIRTNAFVPTLADIIRKDAGVIADYDQLRIETRERLLELDSGKQLAIDCPPQYLRGGVGD